MDNKKLKQSIFEILKQDDRLWNEDKTELNQTLLLDLIEKIDEKVINLLLQNNETKDKYFVKIKDVFVFKTNDFKFFIEENKIDNSYTAYKNRIGLTDGKRFLKDTNDVVLNFPFKDCVLEGGQSTEEGMDTYFAYENEKTKTINGEKVTEHAGYKEKQAKRKEIFFNQVLAKDEIDRLFDDKAFVNWKRFTKDGEQEVKEIKRDADGTIKENLIIKGNNLLALHSLKKQFAGKVKLIYIDPPYNTGNDGFKYNDNFNHSTWLTFMKNRLEVAKELLRDDGVIFVQCDHHEMGYLNVLIDNVFGIGNKIQQIAVKVASASGFKAVNPGPIDVLENILFYGKNKKTIKFQKNYVVTGYHKNYNKYLDNSHKKIENWKLIPLKEKVIQHKGFQNEKDLKGKLGENYKFALQQMIETFAFENANNVVSVRDLHKPTKQVKKLQELSKKERNRFFIYEKQDGEKTYIINGGAIAFYSSKIRKIDGEFKVTELLTNFWDHISWAGIAKEGGVSLKNGKKPEKLLKQIFELNTEKGDIVLDYHLGSGTTCAVAHKMGRQYIGVEQLDYGENDSVVRLKNIINGDQTGISKSANWQDGGNFIYCELAKWNEKAKGEILSCESLDDLEKLFDTLYEKYFLNYNLKIKEFKEKVIKEDNFKALSLEEQKRMFLAMLDLNQMYVQKTEMADKKFGISEIDQKLTEEFYNGEK
jgi:adenine-specific DNA-methyltransferase